MRNFGARLWNGWKRFACTIGFVNEHILLGIVYFLAIGIYAVITAPFQCLRPKPKTAWQPFEDNPKGLEDLEKLF